MKCNESFIFQFISINASVCKVETIRAFILVNLKMLNIKWTDFLKINQTLAENTNSRFQCIKRHHFFFLSLWVGCALLPPTGLECGVDDLHKAYFETWHLNNQRHKLHSIFMFIRF